MSEMKGQPPTAAGPAISELLAPFQQEAAATRLAIEDRSRSQRRINTWLIGFVAVVAVLVVLVLIILIQNRQRSEQTRQVIQTNADLSAKIVDCTSVGGTCYEQAQARTRAALGQLIASNKAIAQCARITATDAQLDACVDARLKTVTPKTTPPNR